MEDGRASRGRRPTSVIRRAGEPALMRGNGIGGIEAHAFALGGVAVCACKAQSGNTPDRGLAERSVACALDAFSPFFGDDGGDP